MTRDKIIIYLNGPPGCGKDLIADYLAENHLAHRFKFATPLRKALCALAGISEEEVEAFKHIHTGGYTSRGVERTGRDIMIEMSENLIKPALGREHFGRLLAEEIVNAHNEICVVSDSGFDYEVAACSQAMRCLIPGGGNLFEVIWQVCRHGHNFEGDSRSYVQVPGMSRKILENHSTLESLYAAVDHCVTSLRHRPVAKGGGT